MTVSKSRPLTFVVDEDERRFAAYKNLIQELRWGGSSPKSARTWRRVYCWNCRQRDLRSCEKADPIDGTALRANRSNLDLSQVINPARTKS